MTWTTWLTWPALALGGLAAAWLALGVYGAARWAASTRALLQRLEATRLPARVPIYDERELEGLPRPVQRYFRAVLKDGQRVVTAATVSHIGRFNLDPAGSKWKPFTSRQRVVTRRPGFVWDARIAILPGLAVHVHDAYVAGTGILEPALLGLYPLADLHGPGEIARGELIRYLAEAAWYPTALLPSQGIHWEAVDARSANATLTDGALGVTMRVCFDEAGLIESVGVEQRGATVGHSVVQMPWAGCWSDYREQGGMLVPMQGEAAWLPSSGRQPYWRGTIVSLSYEFGS